MPNEINERSWIFRSIQPDELNFIYATWLNSYRYDSFLGRSCKNTVFFAEYPKIIDHLLSRPSVKVLVACFPDSPTVILSYLVYEDDCLHYLFTKEIYKKNGIASSLVFEAFDSRMKESKNVYFSHRTLMAEPILQKYSQKLTFNPFRLYQTTMEDLDVNESQKS